MLPWLALNPWSQDITLLQFPEELEPQYAAACFEDRHILYRAGSPHLDSMILAGIESQASVSRICLCNYLCSTW